MKKFLKFKILPLILLLLCAGCATRKIWYYSADVMLPGLTREMKTAGYWIKNHPCPDRVIQSAEQVSKLNESISNMKLVKDISRYAASLPGKKIKEHIQTIWEYERKRKLFFTDNTGVTEGYFNKILQYCGLEKIPETADLSFGFLNRFTHLRSLPDNAFLTETKGESQFDEIQMSGMDIATPLAVLHATKDGKWSFVHTPLADGWVDSRSIALCTQEELTDYCGSRKFIVVTAPKADIFLDESLRDFHEYARMGVRLPVADASDSRMYKILLPMKDRDGAFPATGYVLKNQVNAGYLAYTPRNVIYQAFSLLNTPYGWGDMYGEQDCSRFLCEIFTTVGVILPRNSAQQARIGLTAIDFTKAASLEQKNRAVTELGMPGISLLRMSGHIMLYLGSIDARPYAIHTVWAYRERTGNSETVFLINKTAVTDLDLGKNSERGSLLKRLLSINDPMVEPLRDVPPGL
jgi:hypothetical protein